MARVAMEATIAWRNHLASLRNIWVLFCMLWDTSAWLFVGTILVRIARAILPTALLWMPKQILDGIIASSKGHGDHGAIWRLVLIELILVLCADMLSQTNSILDSLMGERFTSYTATRLIEHVAKLDLTTFENPLFYDKLERAATGRMVLLTSILNAIQECLTVFTLSASINLISGWLLVLLVASIIPTFIGEVRFSKLSYSAFFRRTPQRRELEYLRLLGSWSNSAKELRIFRLGSHLSSQYRELSERIYRENKELGVKRAIGGWLLGLLAALGYYGGYVVALKAALAGAISIGTFTFLTGALARSRLSTERVFSYMNGISEQAVLLTDLVQIFEMVPSICSLPNAVSFPREVREGFEFRNVSFSYPGTSNVIIRNLNLRIRPSEKVALIGPNGAGKTTIVKLLSRLYDPSEGQILLDGIDLRSYDLNELRAHIGVIFQDFMRYDLPVRENIGFGNLRILQDDHHLRLAARRGGADAMIERLEHGYDQVLGWRFKGGAELSGGEWQKVALARAFARDAGLLILDEPTASLDAKAEDELFSRLGSQSNSPMAVMISHRLSIVRRADKAVFLECGEISEEGTHEDLIKLGGRYAEFFHLQAAAFLDVVASRQFVAARKQHS